MPRLKFGDYNLPIAGDELFPVCLHNLVWRLLWIVSYVLVLSWLTNEHDFSACSDQDALVGYASASITVLVLSIICESAIAIISLRGTMVDAAPRQNLVYWLGFHIFLGICQLVCASVGLDAISNHKNPCEVGALYTERVLIGVVIISQVVDATVTILICYLLRPREQMVKVNRDPTKNEIDDSSAIDKLGRSLGKLCCGIQFCTLGCLGGSSVGADLDEVASELVKFFRMIGDVDIVTSDIVAGMALVRLEQRLLRKNGMLKDINSSDKNGKNEITERLLMSSDNTLNGHIMKPSYSEMENLSHFSSSAISMYTILWYLYMSNCCGSCRLCTGNFCTSWTLCCNDANVHGDNCCGAHSTALKQLMKDKKFELLYVTMENDTIKKPYGIYYDLEKKVIVLAMRGTWSLDDCMTDVLFSPEEMTEAGKLWGFNGSGRYCHTGFLRSALWIRQDIEVMGKLSAYTKKYGSKIVVTGHSMGAANAAVLTFLLRPQYPDIKAYCYANPASVFDGRTADETQPYITSVGIGNDWVPGMSYEALLDLRNQVLDAISRVKVGKMTVMKSLLKDYTNATDVLLHPRDKVPESQFLAEINASNAKKANHIEDRVKLYTPGKIIHLEKVEHNKRCCGLMVDKVYTAIQRKKEDYSYIRLSPNMFFDHFPNRYTEDIQKVFEAMSPVDDQV